MSRRLHGEPSFEMPSPLHIYDLASAILGTQGKDQGATLDAAYRGTQRGGFLPISACPWEPSRVLEILDPSEYFQAIDNRAVLAHRLNLFDDFESTVQGLLGTGTPIPVGTTVGSSFDAYRGGIWDGDESGEGHCFCLIGYDATGPVTWYDGVNSWGPQWGEEGFVRMSSRALLRCWSAWAVDATPSYVR